MRHRRGKPLSEVTARDFNAIAKTLCQHGASAGLVSDLSTYFSSQNPRFDPARFSAAASSCKR